MKQIHLFINFQSQLYTKYKKSKIVKYNKYICFKLTLLLFSKPNGHSEIPSLKVSSFPGSIIPSNKGDARTSKIALYCSKYSATLTSAMTATFDFVLITSLCVEDTSVAK